jgi:hypothetical protein
MKIEIFSVEGNIADFIILPVMTLLAGHQTTEINEQYKLLYVSPS